MTWQPMETAPKDGTPILVGRFVQHCEHGRNGRIRVDWWHNAIQDGYTGLGQFNQESWPATHWMPLPEPPLRGWRPAPPGGAMSKNVRDQNPALADAFDFANYQVSKGRPPLVIAAAYLAVAGAMMGKATEDAGEQAKSLVVEGAVVMFRQAVDVDDKRPTHRTVRTQ